MLALCIISKLTLNEPMQVVDAFALESDSEICLTMFAPCLSIINMNKNTCLNVLDPYNMLTMCGLFHYSHSSITFQRVLTAQCSFFL